MNPFNFTGLQADGTYTIYADNIVSKMYDNVIPAQDIDFLAGLIGNIQDQINNSGGGGDGTNYQPQIDVINQEILTISGQIATINYTLQATCINVSTISGEVAVINQDIDDMNQEILTINDNVSTISGEVLGINSTIGNINNTITPLSYTMVDGIGHLLTCNAALRISNSDGYGTLTAGSNVDGMVISLNDAGFETNTLTSKTLELLDATFSTSVILSVVKFTSINMHPTSMVVPAGGKTTTTTTSTTTDLTYLHINQPIQYSDGTVQSTAPVDYSYDIANLNSQVATLNTEVADLQNGGGGDGTNYQPQIDTLNQEVDTLNQEVDTLNQEVDSLKTTYITSWVFSNWIPPGGNYTYDNFPQSSVITTAKYYLNSSTSANTIYNINISMYAESTGYGIPFVIATSASLMWFGPDNISNYFIMPEFLQGQSYGISSSTGALPSYTYYYSTVVSSQSTNGNYITFSVINGGPDNWYLSIYVHNDGANNGNTDLTIKDVTIAITQDIGSYNYSYDISTLNTTVAALNTEVATLNNEVATLNSEVAELQLAVTDLEQSGGGGGGGGDGSMPSGVVISSMSSTVPSGYLYCNGALVSGAVYPDLNKALNGAFGTTASDFYLPDLRGAFLRGIGNNPSNNTNHTGGPIGIPQADAIPSHTHALGTSTANNYMMGSSFTYAVGSGNSSGQTAAAGSGDENRPYNFSVYYYIKT